MGTILAGCRIIVGCEYIFHVIHSSSTTTMASPSDLTILDITGKYTMVRQALYFP